MYGQRKFSVHGENIFILFIYFIAFVVILILSMEYILLIAINFIIL